MESIRLGKDVTVAELLRDGHYYFGGSGDVAPENQVPNVNLGTRNQAEGDIMGQSIAAGDRGNSAALWTSAKLCPYCGVKSPNVNLVNKNGSGVLSLMREGGVSDLEVSTATGSGHLNLLYGVTNVKGEPWDGATEGRLPLRWTEEFNAKWGDENWFVPYKGDGIEPGIGP